MNNFLLPRKLPIVKNTIGITGLVRMHRYFFPALPKVYKKRRQLNRLPSTQHVIVQRARNSYKFFQTMYSWFSFSKSTALQRTYSLGYIISPWKNSYWVSTAGSQASLGAKPSLLLQSFPKNLKMQFTSRASKSHSSKMLSEPESVPSNGPVAAVSFWNTFLPGQMPGSLSTFHCEIHFLLQCHWWKS